MKLLFRYMRTAAYRTPLIGHFIRHSFEKIKGERDYGTQEYWDCSLQTWAKSYLAGTIQIDTRNAITAILIRHMGSQMKSVLDVGCAGGTLASLIEGCPRYCGIDISHVAIDEAIKLGQSRKHGPKDVCHFVSDLRNFHTDDNFDVIVFNEVLYYLTLEDAEIEFNRYVQYLLPGGLIIVSLKNDDISRIILKLLCKRHQRIYGIIFQAQPEILSWKITYTREAPAIFINVFRPAVSNA